MCGTGTVLAPDTLACWIFSTQGLAHARNIRSSLAAAPWDDPDGRPVAGADLFAAARLADPFCHPVDHLAPEFAAVYRSYRAHIFLAACGIAVRTVAPLLLHKRLDPPVLVVDPAARFVICLLSGHTGGGNSLTRHLAALLHATPVITTASDTLEEPALDLLLQQAGLEILDWDRLPRLQGCLLDGQDIPFHDPLNAFTTAAQNPHLLRREPAASSGQSITVHWRRQPERTGQMRVVIPCLVLGTGCRRNVPAEHILEDFVSLCATFSLEEKAFLAVATVGEKAEEPAIRALAEHCHLPLALYPAAELAGITTPNPSTSAGRRFQQPPFSVSEAAALCWFIHQKRDARLLHPKTCFRHESTFAVAIDTRFAGNQS